MIILITFITIIITDAIHNNSYHALPVEQNKSSLDLLLDAPRPTSLLRGGKSTINDLPATILFVNQTLIVHDYRKALEIELKVLRPDHPSTAESYNNIGVVYYKKGDYENAFVEHRKALEIRLKVLRPKHLSTAESYNIIGWVYFQKGDYENALFESS